MKAEFVDITDTQKTLTIEIPSEIVDAEINRIARGYTKQAKLPGFRPGKAPATIIKQRFREQILHEVMHGLIPRAVEEALQERGIEPVDTPDIKNVALNEGQPLKFTAAIETVPTFDPGELSTISVSQPPVTITEDAVERMMQRLRERAAKYETIEGRPVAEGDTVVADIERIDASGKPDRHRDANIEVGSPSNPPGFDANLIGLNPGDQKTFEIQFPGDYPIKELAGTNATYTVQVKNVRVRVLPTMDDEFARDLGEFDSLAALRDRVRTDLQAEAEETSRRQVRADLLKQLSQRIGFDPPVSLVEREIDRRLEEFARQLIQQNVDPRQSGIDWAQFREAQRDPANVSVASALVLDEIARRENLTVTAADVDKEIEQFAERAGRTPAAIRAQMEKEGGVSRLAAGLRREKAVDLVLSRARITTESHQQTISD
jgi:trigger factor